MKQSMCTIIDVCMIVYFHYNLLPVSQCKIIRHGVSLARESLRVLKIFIFYKGYLHTCTDDDLVVVSLARCVYTYFNLFNAMRDKPTK
jgi:hypothetical protein